MISRYRLMVMAFLCLAITTASAQPEISKTPVSSEIVIKERLFNLDTLDINYYFRANLPGDNFLVMEFKKLSYWPGKGQLREIFQAAKDVVKNTADSFRNPGTSKRVDIHIPSKGEPMTVRLYEHNDRGDLLVVQKGEQAPLKVGMDTIRVMRTYAEITEKKDKKLVQVQYTLILKDLEQVKTLVNNTAVEDAENTFDSLVNSKRKKWSNQDLWYHAIDAVYNPVETKPKKRLQVDGALGLLRGYSVDINVGVSLYQNMLAPSLDYCINYKWLKKNKEFSYIGLSMSALYFFQKTTTGTTAYNLTFINLESGTLFNKTNTLVPVYKTSIGIGVLVPNEYSLPGSEDGGFSMFVKYSLSKAVTISPVFYFPADENQSPFIGLTANFKIL